MATFNGPAAVVEVAARAKYEVKDYLGNLVAVFFDPVMAQAYAEWVSAKKPRVVDVLEDKHRDTEWMRCNFGIPSGVRYRSRNGQWQSKSPGGDWIRENIPNPGCGGVATFTEVL